VVGSRAVTTSAAATASAKTGNETLQPFASMLAPRVLTLRVQHLPLCAFGAAYASIYPELSVTDFNDPFRESV
jgi:hypothetical protein